MTPQINGHLDLPCATTSSIASIPPPDLSATERKRLMDFDDSPRSSFATAIRREIGRLGRPSQREIDGAVKSAKRIVELL
jgi:hypothetical protein